MSNPTDLELIVARTLEHWLRRSNPSSRVSKTVQKTSDKQLESLDSQIQNVQASKQNRPDK